MAIRPERGGWWSNGVKCCVEPRSWKDADAQAAMREFLLCPPPRRAVLRDLMAELLSSNPFSRRCAADLARRVSVREPGVLRKFAAVFIDLLAELPANEWQTRGYVALSAALNASTHAERMNLAVLVRPLIEDVRIAVRAMALEAFAILGAAEPELRDEATILLERYRRDPTPAMRCRAQRMSLVLLESEVKLRPRTPSRSRRAPKD
jgi:hypothetical protein